MSQGRDAPFHWQVRVRFGDTDPYGVVYFASYFRYMKEALDEFLRVRGLPPERTYRDAEGERLGTEPVASGKSPAAIDGSGAPSPFHRSGGAAVQHRRSAHGRP
jgi:hypothetical protein